MLQETDFEKIYAAYAFVHSGQTKRMDNTFSTKSHSHVIKVYRVQNELIRIDIQEKPKHARPKGS